MTAAHQPHPAALEVVSDPDDTTEHPTGADAWRAHTVIDQYGPAEDSAGSFLVESAGS